MRNILVRKNIFLISILLAGLIVSGCGEKMIKVELHQGSLFSDQRTLISSNQDLFLRNAFKLSNNNDYWQLMYQITSDIAPSKSEPYSVVVVESDLVNAFATATHRFYVTTGLLALVGSEDELAGIVAHEISHVELNHYESMISDYAFARRLIDQFQMASQKRELEADKNAIKILKNTKYKPQGFLLFFSRFKFYEDKMLEASGQRNNTHPDTFERANIYRKELEKDGITNLLEFSESSTLFSKAVSNRKSNNLRAGLYIEEPPRFKSHDKKFDDLFLNLYGKIRINLDVEKAILDLDKMKSSVEVSDLQKNAINLALLRAYILLRKFDDFDKLYSQVQFNLLDDYAYKWLQIERDFAKNENDNARKKWNALFYDQQCQMKLDCVRRGAELSFQYLLKEQESFEAISIFKKKLDIESNLEEKNQSRKSLEYFPVRDVIENLRTAQSPKDSYTPTDIVPLVLLSDWILYEKNQNKEGINWNTGAKGYFMSLGAISGQTISGDVNTDGRFALELGYRTKPWEFALYAQQYFILPAIASYSNGLNRSNTSLSDSSLTVSYDLSSGLSHFYSKANLSAVYVSRKDDVGNGSALITSGYGYGISLGYYWAALVGRLACLGIDGGLKFERFQMSPYWGTDGRMDFAGAYLNFRISGGRKEPYDYKNDIFKAPKELY